VYEDKITGCVKVFIDLIDGDIVETFCDDEIVGTEIVGVGGTETVDGTETFCDDEIVGTEIVGVGGTETFCDNEIVGGDTETVDDTNLL